MTIDKRKNYYLTIDTETTNTLDDPLVFDIGGCVYDKAGNEYEKFSFVIFDIFCIDERYNSMRFLCVKTSQI